jgi:hypothetical protein
MAASPVRSNRSGSAVNVLWSAYLGCSVVLLVALCLDPYFNRPSGWIKLELFTRDPVRHGVDPCAWDFDGSWKIGGFSGPSPTTLNISDQTSITCADVTSRSVSFVSTPFLHIPGGETLPANRCLGFMFSGGLPQMNHVRHAGSVPSLATGQRELLFVRNPASVAVAQGRVRRQTAY